VVPRERCAAGRSAFPPLGRRGDQLHAGERRGHRFLVHWAHRGARGASGGRHVGWDAALPSRPDRCGRAGALSGFAGRARLDAERSGGRQEPTPPARGAWMRTRRKDSVSWRRLVAPVTVRLLADRLSVGPRPARDRCQRSRAGEAVGSWSTAPERGDARPRARGGWSTRVQRTGVVRLLNSTRVTNAFSDPAAVPAEQAWLVAQRSALT
jgi:hypothetical protein